jgi:hypothetical protein
MSRRPRCPTGKLIFHSEERAELAACSLTRRNLRLSRPAGRTAARAYPCTRCGAWHLTSQEVKPTPLPALEPAGAS